jgi:hypothetical protein
MDEHEERLAHLERLRRELQDRGFTAELASEISKPYLTVAHARQPQLNERVYCEQASVGSWSFYWPWQAPISLVNDLSTAVDEIAGVLQTVASA